MVRAGRSFLRCMIDLLHAVHRPPSVKHSSGLQGRLSLVARVSGAVPSSHTSRASLQTHLFTDSSGSWGWHGDAWFQVEWDCRSQSLSIAEKELILIVLACQVWVPVATSSAPQIISQLLQTCGQEPVSTRGRCTCCSV